jgi:hypothetical protein
MNIDDPMNAANAQIASDERQRSAVTEIIVDAVAAIEIPGAGAVASFLDKRRAENRDLLVRVIRDELHKLTERVGQLSERHKQFIQTDFAELVTDGLRKAENIRAKERIVRIGMILATAAQEGPRASPDETEELMRVAAALSDLDVAVLREIHQAQREYLKNNQAERVDRETANEAWRDSPPQIAGVSDGEIQSCCSKLQSFGLVARIERNDFKLGPNEIPYALLKRGAVFIEFIRNE